MDLNANVTSIIVAGETVEVGVNDSVLHTIKRIVREKGLGNPVTVIVDGVEVINPSDLPETFGDHEIEVRRYMKAG